ncbi:Uncharacterised protein [Mycobacteroides abscessus subsp. abscessus]|jgi:hypothetical protein|nr:Uncharacterised protein [Mycobacteroides abscessus subsp. abscessus]SIJ99628.1 Uncharacterised protein [Mycobacteroides abscessus subsp. bolletii]SIE45538.1 Uncharacterised protein [Mycobacteroides abscessus subsp. abscessus]SKD12343.1 Uncharacterised protein [Mycobacteroides abscessus subsp. abscessus]SKL17707.1 Uncharacterised protein [Mycobacteroides abscessus subsp. abscessus]
MGQPTPKQFADAAVASARQAQASTQDQTLTKIAEALEYLGHALSSAYLQQERERADR